jgi:hypothetical protein
MADSQRLHAEAAVKTAKAALAKEAAAAVHAYVAAKKEGIELPEALLKMLEGE